MIILTTNKIPVTIGTTKGGRCSGFLNTPLASYLYKYNIIFKLNMYKKIVPQYLTITYISDNWLKF